MEGHQLELRREESGLRHYVDNQAVRGGSFLEMLTGDGWVTGRYEWTFNADSKPFLMVSDDQLITLDSDAQLRWPAK
jgi:hypothetical protein